MKLPDVFKVLVITLSDRAAAGEYDDLSGPLVQKLTEQIFEKNKLHCSCDRLLIPDSSVQLESALRQGSQNYNLIITTGGTGIGPRDITVDTVKPLLIKEIPGIMEFIRFKYGADKPNALLSRSIAGIIGISLIYTLPGSVKAVTEYMDEIGKTLIHTILMQYGIDSHPKVSG
jgi:molybdopterin adenylyltransferase